MTKFRPNLGKFWPKWVFFWIFAKKGKKKSTPETRRSAKTSIFGHIGPKWPILVSFWQKRAKREFFKKALGTFLSRLQALTNCKVSEKSNERFSRNCVTHGQTDVIP